MVRIIDRDTLRRNSIKERMDKTPDVPRDLVDWLLKQYPEVLPSTNTPITDIMKMTGKRELVLRLWEMAYESD